MCYRSWRKNAIGIEISSILHFSVQQLFAPIMFGFQVKIIEFVISNCLYIKFCYIKILFGNQSNKIKFSLELYRLKLLYFFFKDADTSIKTRLWNQCPFHCELVLLNNIHMCNFLILFTGFHKHFLTN